MISDGQRDPSIILDNAGGSASSKAPATLRATAHDTGALVGTHSHPPTSRIKSPRTALPHLSVALSHEVVPRHPDRPTPSTQKRTPRLAAATAAIQGPESSVVNRVTSAVAERRLEADEVLLDLDEMRMNPP